MSEFHKGNVLNQITEEEHDHDNYAKRVNVVAGGVGLATITVRGNVTLSNPNTYIGLTTTTLGRGHQYIGLATVQQVGLVTVVQASAARTITGNLTLSNPNTFIGLVTAVSVNGGTNKTLIPKNFSFAQASVTTIAVPAATFNITSLIANSNATVGIRIKSGATYLIGNVSLSVMLNPGGGWVQHGTPDSPVYKGLAGTAAIVIEKEDLGQVAEIAGHLMYYDE